jgi:predicted dehydrogenase
MYNVKVHGAGSIGNHLSQAARRLNWDVTICDVDEAALARTRNDIYPSRYGKWDDSIQLCLSEDAPRGGFDIIFIGTPPDIHMELAIEAIEENPAAILIEKPLCTPYLERADELVAKAAEKGIKVFVGYDHVVGMASDKVDDVLEREDFGAIETIDVEFREHWGGIFAAHSWLAGPQDSYLGYWERGGGASGEHSHAINLWQHFANLSGAGRVRDVSATLDIVDDGVLKYDKICAINVKTENGLVGRIVQDVITNPPRKWARLQGSQGYVEWQCGIKPGCDGVFWVTDGNDVQETIVEKTRPDDFLKELKHIAETLKNPIQPSVISLEKGLDTMMVIAAIHKSAELGQTIQIDYDKGYNPSALKSV